MDSADLPELIPTAPERVRPPVGEGEAAYAMPVIQAIAELQQEEEQLARAVVREAEATDRPAAHDPTLVADARAAARAVTYEGFGDELARIFGLEDELAAPVPPSVTQQPAREEEGAEDLRNREGGEVALPVAGRPPAPPAQMAVQRRVRPGELASSPSPTEHSPTEPGGEAEGDEEKADEADDTDVLPPPPPAQQVEGQAIFIVVGDKLDAERQA